MTCRELADVVEQLSLPTGSEEGFKWGDPQAELTGCLVCWMATMDAIADAAAQGCNMIVCHESLTFPYSHISPGLENYTTWTVNRRRLTALSKHDLCVYQSHSTLDRFSILKTFTDLVGLGEPTVYHQGYVQVFEIAPVTMGELAARVKAQVGMERLRVCGPLDKVVRRVGCPWGGVGLSLNMGFIEQVIARGAEVLISGEADEYAMRYALDAGVPTIETGHSISENPGLRRAAEHLAGLVPGQRIIFHENPPAWVSY